MNTGASSIQSVGRKGNDYDDNGRTNNDTEHECTTENSLKSEATETESKGKGVLVDVLIGYFTS